MLLFISANLRGGGGGTNYTLTGLAGAYSLSGGTATLTWSGESPAGFSQEIELRKWYVRRDKKLHIFSSAQDADAFIESEAAAQEAVQKAQKTSRLARKRMRDRLITALPEKTIQIDLLAQLVSRYEIPVNLPQLVAQQDYDRVLQIMALALQMQDQEDEELLLLMG